MARRDAVDSHDPPTWMRDLVHLRDEHCIFPRCHIDARSCDLDHTTPYDQHGPPGQTRPDNLAALCRRHHRAKTTGRWWYLRTPDGDYHLARPLRHDLPRHSPRHPPAALTVSTGQVRMFTARATIMMAITNDTDDCTSITIFAQRVTGNVSVGLRAVELVKAR